MLSSVEDGGPTLKNVWSQMFVVKITQLGVIFTHLKLVCRGSETPTSSG